MTPQLRLFFLGAPQFFIDDQPLTTFNSNKTRALLAFLALTQKTYIRATLAGLFWGDLSEKQAHANLRKSILNLKKHADAWLDIQRQTIAFKTDSNYWLDTEAFIAESLPEKAIELYGGDFLEGLLFKDAPELEHWILEQRTRFKEQMLQMLHQSIHNKVTLRRYAEAIGDCQTLLRVEPWREETHQQLILLYYRNGNRSAALAQFRQCKEVLWEEIGVLPSSETESLYERILKAVPPKHNVPAEMTPFIGREQEITDLQIQLLQPECRLTTILGPGGIGKTRLALATSITLIDHFIEGVWFVDLTNVDHVDLVANAIGAAIGLRFVTKEEPAQQLVRFLRQQECLLILDNMEHLTDAASLLSDILRSAPDVTLLVTSRQELLLKEEWIWTIDGLDFPQLPPLHDLQSYSACRLFGIVAQRRNRHFELQKEGDAVAQICNLVEGVPLALELAAAATRHESCASLAIQLQQNVNALQSQWRNVPDRHRSLRAVFDHSWALLTADEQLTFQKLAIFNGPFSIDAAAQVTNISPDQLDNLVGHSLLRKVDAEHFVFHSLIHQFAHEKLASNNAFSNLSQAHTHFYLDLIAKHGTEISSADSLEASRQIEFHFDNIVAAWRWASTHYSTASSNTISALYSWLDFFIIGGNRPTGYTIFSQLANRSIDHSPLQVHLQTCLANLELVTGRSDASNQRIEDIKQSREWQNSLILQIQLLAIEAQSSLQQGEIDACLNMAQQGLSLLEKHAVDRLELILLGILASANLRKPDIDEALLQTDRLQTRAAAMQDRYHESVALQRSGVIHQYYRHDYEAAALFYQQALEIAEPLQFKTLIADCRAYLGNVYSLQHKYQKSIDLLQQALRLYRELGEPITQGLTLVNLCHTHDALDQFEHIERRSREAISLLVEAGAPYYEADGRALCSSYAIASGDFMGAKDHLSRALEIARSSADQNLLARVLWRYAWLATTVGDFQLAEAMLSEAKKIPQEKISSEKVAGQHLAGALLKQYQGQLPAALKTIEKANELAQNIAPYWVADCAMQTGYILLELKRWQEAYTQFEVSADIRQGIRQIEAQVGMAVANLNLGQKGKSLDLIKPFLNHTRAQNQILKGAWQPAFLYLNAYQTLQKGDEAFEMISAGHDLIYQQGRKLDSEWQNSFWNNVPTHKRLQKFSTIDSHLLFAFQ